MHIFYLFSLCLIYQTFYFIYNPTIILLLLKNDKNEKTTKMRKTTN
uniref:Uncharacterized protein n=1 Tax=viral metagenome TaxID=1070528 RepID=A0A6C0JIY2_9ZZZZ